MLYRALRMVNRAYPYVVFWVYVAMFLLALPFMFIFPLLPLVLVMLGAFGVAVVFMGRKLLLMPQHMIAHHAVNKGKCPRCGEFVVTSTGQLEAVWHCVTCGTHYAENGAEVDPPIGVSSVADHEARLA